MTVLPISLGPASAAGGQAVTIDLDATMLLQVVVFSLLVFLLKPLLFDPVLRIFAAREARTEGAKGEARELQERAGALLRRYEAELQRINQVAAQERDRVRGETAKLEAEIMHEAREVTTKVMAEGRQRIETEVARLRTDLHAQSQRLAGDIADAAAGRGGQV